MAGIFKAYDIRGIYQEQLTEELTYKIGLALASQVYKAGDKILVSRDARTHSPSLFAQLIEGLRDGGCDVLSIGLAATPMNYWANVQYQVQGSVMLTASHNSAKYNGLKISLGQAIPVSYNTGINLVEQAINEDNLPKADSKGSLEELNQEEVLEKYLDSKAKYLVADKQDPKPLKLAVDCANGMGGLFIKEFTNKFPWIELVPLYCDIDCTFPNHEADPLKVENLQDLCKLVKQEHCDFGVSFDGDADRAVFVDETGEPVSSDIMTALIAEYYLKHTSDSESRNIGYDLRSSKSVKEAILKYGGKPFRTKVGHSNIKQQMREENIIFAGELSGHFYYKDLSYTDSALMSLIQVINIWQEFNSSLHKLTQHHIQYFASGEINYKVQDVQATINKIKSNYTELEQDELDGLTVTDNTWWLNLRASNTEPLLRLNLEADTQDILQDKLQEVEKLIKD